MNLEDTAACICELNQLNQSCYRLNYTDEAMFNRYNGRLHILQYQIKDGDKKTAEIIRMYADYKVFEMALPDNNHWGDFEKMLEPVKGEYNGKEIRNNSE